MAIDLQVPEVGESVTEVEIGRWLKGEGDAVARDEAVCEIETDKVTVELPAPSAGTISAILKQQGESATVGETIGRMEAGEAPAEGGGESGAAAAAAPAEAPGGGEASKTEGDGETGHVMPAAERALQEHGLRPDQVEATGPGGRILKEDVERAAGSSKAPAGDEGEAAAPAGGSEAGTGASSGAGERQEEAVPMTPLRRRVASHLVHAQQSAAMLTTFNDVDMSAVMSLRERYRDTFQEAHGIKLGFMSFFVHAVIHGLKRVPELNAEIRDDTIVYRNYYDIGIAVSTDKGLVVPVVRDAHKLGLAEIEAAIADLGKRANNNQLQLDELKGGTFSITNGGIFGSLLSTPILNPPQSGILGMHRIEKRPVAIGDEVAVRPMMYIALTYDHRIVDGRGAVTFLRHVKEAVEDPQRLLLEV